MKLNKLKLNSFLLIILFISILIPYVPAHATAASIEPEAIKSKGNIVVTGKGQDQPSIVFQSIDLFNLLEDFKMSQETAEATRAPMIYALQLKGVPLSKNASYQEIAEGILRIPNEYIWGKNDPAGVTYQYHNHIDQAGEATNDTSNNAILTAKGGCYNANVYHSHTGNTVVSGGCYTIPVYHRHSGSTAAAGGCYTIPVYHTHSGSTTAAGGCYTTPIYHTHSGDTGASGGCYIIPVYHTHTSVCQSSTRCECRNYSQGKFLGYHEIDGWPMWECNNCGHGNWEHDADSRCGHITTITCPKTAGVTVDSWETGCNKTPDTIESYELSCGKTTNTIEVYSLGCGKTTSTVESYALGCGQTTSTVTGYKLDCNHVENQIVSAAIRFEGEE